MSRSKRKLKRMQISAYPSKPGNPPNVSGDPSGYNTKLFNGVKAVIQGFKNASWKYKRNFYYSGKYPDTGVNQFQHFYNAGSFPGELKTDGIPGPHTLNALEIALKA